MSCRNLNVKRGDTWRLQYKWTSNNVSVDLTGCTARAQVRLRRVGTLLSTVTTSSGITIDGVNGLVTVSFPPTDTANATAGTYETDVQITYPDSTVQSSGTVELRVEEDVTYV